MTRGPTSDHERVAAPRYESSERRWYQAAGWASGPPAAFPDRGEYSPARTGLYGNSLRIYSTNPVVARVEWRLLCKAIDERQVAP